MLRFFYNTGEFYPLTGIENFYLLHKSDGNIRLSFDIPVGHPLYNLISEECELEYGDNKFIVKKVKNGTIECDLNFDFLKRKIYKNYCSESVTLSELLYSHLPEGWKVIDGNITSIRRTTSFDFCTDYDVIISSMSTYGVFLEWSLVKKQLKVYPKNFAEVTGEYVTDELNLRNISFQGDTLNFITRLYAWGKDGLSFADINDGKEYVENFEYSNKIICGYWSDDRYTVKENLLKDTIEKLKALAFPVRSYECDVVDLAKMKTEYSFLKFKLHKAVMLIDRQHNIKVQHRIVQYKEYPEEPQRNVITLSCVPSTISTTIGNISSSINSEIDHTVKTLNNAILKATQAITGNSGGYVVFRPAEQPQEILIMDTPNVETATNVWRWNLAGLGHSSTGAGNIGDTTRYTIAMTYDGSFVADFIRVGVLEGSLLRADSVQGSSISQSYTDSIINEVNGTINKIAATFQATAEGLTSQITHLAKTISDNNEYTEEQINSLKNSIAGLTYSVQRTYRGGINSIINSSGMNGVSDDWIHTGTVQAIEDSSTTSGCCFRLGEDSTLSQTVHNLIVGSAYSFSVRIKKSYAQYTGFIKVIHGDTTEIVFQETAAQKQWLEFFVAIPSLSSTDLTILISSTKNYMYVADMILVEGMSFAPIVWQPSHNEIYTTEVKIDKNGIRVIKSDSSVATNISNDAFRVQRRNNQGTYDDSVRITEDEAMVNEMTLKGTTKFVGSSKTMFKPCTDGIDIIVLD